MWLATRVVLYYIVSCFLLFVGIPWLIRQLDVYLPNFAFGWIGRWAGGAIFVVALAVYTVCAFWLMATGRGPYIEFDPPTQLVSTGPYRWCRNPVAAAVLIAILGEAVFFSSPALLGLFLLGMPVAHAQAVLLEEPLLKRRFGAVYDAYCREVPRWLPQRSRATDPARSS